MQVPAMPDSQGPQSPKPRILVVDDAPDVAMTMMMLLKMFGYEVAQAHSGWAAIESARQQRPDIVFLDIGLPDMSGFEVAERLRTDLGLEQSVLVAVSGFDEDEDRLRASAFNRHLVKPVSVQTLKQLLNELTTVGS
jgi:two-component system CheB/CheR fusion protein